MSEFENKPQYKAPVGGTYQVAIGDKNVTVTVDKDEELHKKNNGENYE